MMTKIIFIPGNGGSTTHDNWFPSVKKELEAQGLPVVAAPFPDPILARESIWIPFFQQSFSHDFGIIGKP